MFLDVDLFLGESYSYYFSPIVEIFQKTHISREYTWTRSLQSPGKHFAEYSLELLQSQPLLLGEDLRLELPQLLLAETGVNGQVLEVGRRQVVVAAAAASGVAHDASFLSECINSQMFLVLLHRLVLVQ